MICRNCGQEFDGNFCPECGMPAPQPSPEPVITQDEPAQPDLSDGYANNTASQPTPDVEQPFQPSSPGVSLGNNPPQQPYYQNNMQGYQNAPGQPGWNNQPQPGQPWNNGPMGQPPKKKHTGLIIGCVIGGVVLIVVILFILIFSVTNGIRNAVSSGDMGDDTAYSQSLPEEDDISSEPEQPAASSQPSDDELQYYSSGEYLVGTDLPAGEYLVISESEWGSYLEVRNDTNWMEIDDEFITNDSFDNRTFVAVEDGTYLQLRDCKAVLASEAPAFSGENGYPEGTYRVGIDIPAGTYTVSQLDPDFSGYYEIRNNISNSISNILENDNFEGEATITVTDGQYLTLSLSEIKP